jgi:YbbR domain-containing protein
VAQRLLRQWQLKVLSLVFAVALWAVVASEDRGEAVFSVPIDVKGLPPGLAVASLGVEAVDVRVQGLRHVLARLQEQNVRAELELQTARPGDTILTIRPEDIVVPRGVQVVRVTPTRVRVTVESVQGRRPRPLSP